MSEVEETPEPRWMQFLPKDLTTQDLGIHQWAGYFCTECCGESDHQNNWDGCSYCDGVVVPVWLVAR
jgi:hypothetical protein